MVSLSPANRGRLASCIVARAVSEFLNRSDIGRGTIRARNGGGAVPFGSEEVCRRPGAKGAKLAHQMRLVGITGREGEVGPPQRRTKRRLLPRAGEARQSFKTLG